MSTEPIAIIGMACRFPGANNPAELWQLLRGGVDAVTEIPADRWNADRFYDEDASVPGKMNTRWGGFLERIGYFDAHFFRVSPREAPHLDPQQRFLMEATWEALEDAGQVPGNLAGTRTGVFIGIMGSDYADTPMNDPMLVNFYTVTGHSRGIAANRLSHFFDFRGPSMSVDTACSSSLVATNLACRSLWSGESTLAIAGGANLILSPEGTIWYAKAGLLARDGRCKTFDSRADGLVRGEGVGVVVLKLLSRALADGDPIHAVIKGGAINQDGRSNGLTAPNRWAQEALIREACAQADVSPGQVSYVEAHGTGTALGDPIEAQALGAVLATDRSEGNVCAIGSIKSNIGHLEAAAGVAGLIKVVLMLKHREIPPSLHYRQPNPHIPFAQLPLRVQTSLTPWSIHTGPALAGVNAFGFGGTNAHLVVSEAPKTDHAAEQVSQDRAELLPLSARSPEALRALALAYQQFLLADGADVSLRDICYTAAVRRTHHEHRVALAGNSHADLAARLENFIEGTTHPAISTGRVTQIRRAKLAFVFAGQGPQWWAMGRRLLRDEEVFRRAVEECDGLFRHVAGWSLVAELTASEDQSRMAETQMAQPCLFALQVGLAALWQAWGVKPDAVAGHSIGEVAAVYVAGALSLEDAVRVVFHRSRLMQRATGKGKMAAVALPPNEVAPFLAGYEKRVNVAAHNAPCSCVISGETAALDEVAGALRTQGIQVQELRVDYAFHSRQMWEFGDELFASLAGIEAGGATIPIFSTLTGTACEGAEFGADYWRRQLRETVQFATAADAMLAAGYNTFVELSPHPVLVGALHECIAEHSGDCAAMPSLRRNEDERSVMLKSAARLYTLGFPLKWKALQAKDGRCVSLPRYQWQRERYWLKEQETRNDRRPSRVDEVHATGLGSLVGRCMASAIETETYHWEFDIDAVRLPLLLDHRVQDRTVVPAAMFIEMALAGAAGLSNGAGVDPFDVSFARALALRDGETRRMQLVIRRASEHAFGFQLFSREQGDNLHSPWTLHGRGQLHLHEDNGDGLQRVEPEEIRERCDESVTGEDFYREMSRRGLVYGPTFQGVKQVWRRAGEAIAGISLDAAFMKDAAASGVHPLLLDNCLQVIACAFPPRTGEVEGFTYLPVGVERVRVGRKHLTEGVAWSYARLKTSLDELPEVLTADAMLTTALGDVVLELHGVRLQRVRGGPQPEAARAKKEDVGEWLYEIDWRQSELPSTEEEIKAEGKLLIFADRSGVGEVVKSRLETEGAASCVLVRAGRAFKRAGRDEFEIDPASAQDFDRLLAEASTDEPQGWRGVVHLWSLDQAVEEPAQGCASILHLVQSLDRAGLTHSLRLWLVTSGTQPAASGPVNIAQSPVWGLGRVIAREFHSLRCTMIDVNHATHDDNASAVFQELRSASDEQQVVWRDAARYVARLQRRKNVAREMDHISLHADATYLITGGLGGLGLKLAAWMVQRGAKHLVLIGRSGAPASASEVIASLEAAGAHVRVVAADVSDQEQVAQILAEIAATMPPLKGVVHAAGVLEDALLRHYDHDRFARVLAPKIHGAWNLHSHTLDSNLDFFVLFSSISSLLGSPGQGAYAAGNSFLDALAHQRRALGLHGLSINWGPWAKVGMAASRSADFARQGVGSIEPEAGLRVLERLLLEDATQVGVLPVRWPEFISTFSPSPKRELFLSDFFDEAPKAQDHSSESQATSALVAQLTQALPSERVAILSARLQFETCRVLGLPLSTQLDVTQGFFDLGMDSLMIAELNKNLQTAIERQFPLSMMFEHANIEALTRYLFEQ
ncbi:MAG TPA: type I polyketide synthase, partial [Pyrinomonadaceae bacterium]|nr:type I polyketide synthase [Pyrinomonadaceae bacterium]